MQIGAPWLTHVRLIPLTAHKQASGHQLAFAKMCRKSRNIDIECLCRFFAKTALDPSVNVKHVQAIRIGLDQLPFC